MLVMDESVPLSAAARAAQVPINMMRCSKRHRNPSPVERVLSAWLRAPESPVREL